MNKYIRFATRIPSNEVALAVDVDRALRRQEELSKDIIEAREKYSPKARLAIKKTKTRGRSKTMGQSRSTIKSDLPNRYSSESDD